jgi:hypothetical protein
VEPSDDSRLSMETDKDLWEKMQKEIDLPKFTEKQLREKLVLSYLQKPEMIRFLLQDALAIKLLLLDKGLITVEEFDKFKAQAGEILNNQINNHIDERLANNPAEAKLFDVLLGRENIKDLSFDDLNKMGD